MSNSNNLGNKGLHNLGNTCYMNSVCQCLSHLTIFHPKNSEFINECDNISKDTMMYQWIMFQKNMWICKDPGCIYPDNLLKCFSKNCKINNSYFDNFEQNDVEEFLILFLDFLHKSIPCTMDIVSKNYHENKEINKIIVKSQDVWKRFYKNDYSYIVEKFYSQLLSYTTCPDCNYYTTNHDPIQILSLEIKNAISLYDCLNNFTKTNTLDENNMWTCDNCKRNVLSEKKILLWKTSDILIISLKRFALGKKINNFIRYPEILEMEKYNINYGTSKNNRYELQCMTVHVGNINAGHYYSICKNILDNKWYKYDDNSVDNYDDKYLQDYPYLLFYKRC